MRLQRTLDEEARLINDEILLKIGGYTPRGGGWKDGKEAILEMRDAGFPPWKEVEWPGYYIKFIIQKAIQEGKLVGFESMAEQKHYLARGRYLWDLRATGEDVESFMLTDCARWDTLIGQYDGIGLIVFVCRYERDKDDKFRKWHMRTGGGESEFVRDRIARGVPPRQRKTGFGILNSFLFYFDRQLMTRGMHEGWLAQVATNMRNSDGSPRNPKYAFFISEAPSDILLGARNFNWDPKEYDEAFGDIEPL